jgi:hypothetical protein
MKDLLWKTELRDTLKRKPGNNYLYIFNNNKRDFNNLLMKLKIIFMRINIKYLKTKDVSIHLKILPVSLNKYQDILEL